MKETAVSNGLGQHIYAFGPVRAKPVTIELFRNLFFFQIFFCLATGFSKLTMYIASFSAVHSVCLKTGVADCYTRQLGILPSYISNRGHPAALAYHDGYCFCIPDSQLRDNHLPMVKPSIEPIDQPR